MNETQFVERREPDWKRLSFLADRADASPSNLTGDMLIEFVLLYRRAATDLARVRSESANRELAAFLNDLVGRCYGILYRSPRRRLSQVVLACLKVGAQTVRRRAGFVLASLGILLASIAFTAGTLSIRPDLRKHFVPAEYEEVFDGWKEGTFEARTGSESIAAWGMYASNNPTVSILAGSVAASTFGVGTANILWENGKILGALASDMASVGKLSFLLASIWPHGASELSGIVMSGAAGLCLGWALIAPGRRARGESLRVAGKDALTLLVLSVVMMLIAAPFEGFLSFNPSAPLWVKAVVGTIMFAAWLSYWMGYGRETSDAAAPPRSSR